MRSLLVIALVATVLAVEQRQQLTLDASLAYPVAPLTKCANENQRCAFDGPMIVKYGDLAKNQWALEKVIVGGVDCNNGVFGDPIVGTVKQCYIRPFPMNRCAKENERCVFQGQKTVLYGDMASGKWAKAAVFENGVACSNGVFGDPAYGIVKACYVSDFVARPPQEWTRCAAENQRCAFDGTRKVRYGDLATNRFAAERIVTNGIDCTNGVWGDPAYGIVKACYVSEAFEYVKCANENQKCAFDGPMIVRYGDLAKNQWAKEKLFFGGVDCNNAVFGDPIYGTVKQCYIRSVLQNRCAKENERCTFTGKKTVVYGDAASNKWAKQQTFENGVACSNTIFGDPAYGIVKACYVSD